ncbi:MAG: 4Fe-4S binding protein [Planctomycetaceae bacterium]|nr:4Fe-4S binding protein [Planctomycetaceae bacterium]
MTRTFKRLVKFCTVTAAVSVLFLCFCTEANAVPRNPPPVFESEYKLPPTDAPLPKIPVSVENFLAVVLYAALIVLAALAAYRWRSRKILFALSVLSVVILGFAMQACPCPVGMLQNIVAAITQQHTFIPWTVLILFLLPLLVSLFFGRVFCSSVCPLGAVQELTLIKPLAIPDGIENCLGIFRYVNLGLAVFFVYTGLGYLVCRFDPYAGFFRLGGLYPIMIYSVVLLIIGMFIGRPFCRFLCPYGGLLSFCSGLSKRKISISPQPCTNCNLCENICPYNAVAKPTAEPTLPERRSGLRWFAFTLLLLPVSIAVFAVIGYYIAPLFAGLHFDVRTAELLYAEEQKLTDAFGTFPETRTVIQTGVPYEEVYKSALAKYRQFRYAGLFLGVWVGLVIGIKLISISMRRKRTNYEVDVFRCVCCGRCYWYCPNQKNERLLLETQESRSTG